MEAELKLRMLFLKTEGIWSQAKGCWQSPGAGRDKKWLVLLHGGGDAL